MHYYRKTYSYIYHNWFHMLKVLHNQIDDVLAKNTVFTRIRTTVSIWKEKLLIDICIDKYAHLYSLILHCCLTFTISGLIELVICFQTNIKN